MKKGLAKRIIAFSIAFCMLIGVVIVGLSGCGKKEDVKPTPQPSQVEIEQSEQSEESVQSTETQEQIEPESETVESEIDTQLEDLSNLTNMGKSIYLADSLYENTQDNIVFSPASLNMALGLVTEGADGNTKALLNQYLGTEDYANIAKSLIDKYNYVVLDAEKDRDLIIAEYEKMYNEYPEGNLTFEDYIAKHKLTDDDIVQLYVESQANMTDRSKLNISNSAWFSETFNPSKVYKKQISDFYNADLETVNFSESLEAVDRINSWCEEKTEGLIPSIIDETDITPETILVLLNTIYFKDKWFDGPWDTYETEDNIFYNLDGSKTEGKLVTKTVTGYYENDYAEAFSLDYVSGLTFYGILPKETGEFNLLDLDLEGLLDSNKSSDYTEIHAYMPEFKTTTEDKTLKAGLIDLGLKEIFSTDANFDGMEENGKNAGICVDDIIQKCDITLDKDGTEAAAATAVTMVKNAMPMVEEEPIIKEIRLDRPFAYMIVEKETNQIMFMGKIIHID